MKCEICKKEHDGSYGSGRFCSVMCAHSFSTKEERVEINQKVSKIMLRRREDYHYNRGKEHPFYGKHHTDSTKEKIRSTLRATYAKRIANTEFEDLDNNNQRRRLLEESNNKCMRCGQDENWNGLPLKFEFHHKDGNRSNRARENCEMICPNCHSQTDNYKFNNRTHTKESIAKWSLTKANKAKVMAV